MARALTATLTPCPDVDPRLPRPARAQAAHASESIDGAEDPEELLLAATDARGCTALWYAAACPSQLAASARRSEAAMRVLEALLDAVLDHSRRRTARPERSMSGRAPSLSGRQQTGPGWGWATLPMQAKGDNGGGGASSDGVRARVSLVHFLAAHGLVGALRTLLRHVRERGFGALNGPDAELRVINQPDQMGRRPLHYAAAGARAGPEADGVARRRLLRRLCCAQLLVSRGAALDAADLEGNTPLHCARGFAMARLLLTVRHTTAAFAPRTLIPRPRVQAGADPSVLNSAGEPAVPAALATALLAGLTGRGPARGPTVTSVAITLATSTQSVAVEAGAPSVAASESDLLPLPSSQSQRHVADHKRRDEPFWGVADLEHAQSPNDFASTPLSDFGLQGIVRHAAAASAG